jgi:hypothetical protein
MMNTFGGFLSVADCPLDSSSLIYSSVSPMEFGSAYDSAYNDPMFSMGYFKAVPGTQQQLASVDYPEEPMYAVPVDVRMMSGRKV